MRREGICSVVMSDNKDTRTYSSEYYSSYFLPTALVGFYPRQAQAWSSSAGLSVPRVPLYKQITPPHEHFFRNLKKLEFGCLLFVVLVFHWQTSFSVHSSRTSTFLFQTMVESVTQVSVP